MVNDSLITYTAFFPFFTVSFCFRPFLMAYLLIDRENVKGRLLQNVLSYTHYNSFIQCKLLMYVIVSVARKTETQTACVNFSSYKCSS